MTVRAVAWQGFWLFERAELIREAKDSKSPLPPPFNFVWNLGVELPMAVFRFLCPPLEEPSPRGGFKRVPNAEDLRYFHRREAEALKRCLSVRRERNLDSVNARTEELKEAVQKLEKLNRTRFETMSGRFEQRFDQLEKKLEQEESP